MSGFASAPRAIARIIGTVRPRRLRAMTVTGLVLAVGMLALPVPVAALKYQGNYCTTGGESWELHIANGDGAVGCLLGEDAGQSFLFRPAAYDSVKNGKSAYVFWRVKQRLNGTWVRTEGIGVACRAAFGQGYSNICPERTVQRATDASGNLATNWRIHMRACSYDAETDAWSACTLNQLKLQGNWP
jgi:hypothetical protein